MGEDAPGKQEKVFEVTSMEELLKNYVHVSIAGGKEVVVAAKARAQKLIDENGGITHGELLVLGFQRKDEPIDGQA